MVLITITYYYGEDIRERTFETSDTVHNIAHCIMGYHFIVVNYQLPVFYDTVLVNGSPVTIQHDEFIPLPMSKETCVYLRSAEASLSEESLS